MFVQCHLGSHTLLKNVETNFCVEQLFEMLKINSSSFYVLHNGHKVEEGCHLEDGHIYHFVPRVLGGKGGFGSMLRAIGAQIEKTTSREACRDLSGRRMRDVNNEKKLKDWLSKESDREREREERRKERLARRLAEPKHNFDDPEYHKQRSKVQDDLDDALQKGLKRANGKSDGAAGSSQSKKLKSNDKQWLGVDIDSDDLESDSDSEANPGSSGTDTEAHPGPPDMADVEKLNCNAKAMDVSSSEDIKAMDVSSSEDIKAMDASSSEDIKADIKCESGDGAMEDAKGKAQGSEADSSSEAAAALAVEVKEEIVNIDEPVDLSEVDSVGELVAMGLERLKNALISRGMKCGGTLEERAGRLFSIKGLTPDQIPTSLMVKAKGVGKKSK